MNGLMKLVKAMRMVYIIWTPLFFIMGIITDTYRNNMNDFILIYFTEDDI